MTSAWFWLGLLPCLILFLFFWYGKKNIDDRHQLDNIYWILILISAFVPVLSWVTIGVVLIIFCLSDNIILKDTKLNRFLFNSYFRKK